MKTKPKKKPQQQVAIPKPKRKTYYSISWRIKGHQLTTSGCLTSVASQAVHVLGLGADCVVIMKCQTD